MLESNGISRNDWEAYERSFHDDDGRIRSVRNDGYIVGVADPTASLPNDSVFVTGLKPMYCGDQVFIMRNPCTEKTNGKLLKVITSRPNGMSSKAWNYLDSIPYGLLVFGQSSTSRSLPEQIGNGDLDGDSYHVLFDATIVKKIGEFNSRNIDDMTSSSKRSKIHYQKNVLRDFLKKNPGAYNDGGNYELNPSHNWFENAQDYSAEIKHLYYQSQLTSFAYKQWKTKVNEELGYTDTTDALSYVYKTILNSI